MGFISKKKKIVEEVDEEEEEEEEEDEEEEEEEVPTPTPTKKSSTNKDITKQEIADIIEGNLNRALQLLQYLRQ